MEKQYNIYYNDLTTTIQVVGAFQPFCGFINGECIGFADNISEIEPIFCAVRSEIFNSAKFDIGQKQRRAGT